MLLSHSELYVPPGTKVHVGAPILSLYLPIGHFVQKLAAVEEKYPTGQGFLDLHAVIFSSHPVP